MGCCCAKGPESGSASWNDSPWCGDFDDKLYLQSGEFSSTIKTSMYVGSNYITTDGISWDGRDTPVSSSDSGYTVSKLVLYSGQFSSTIVASVDVSSISAAFDISWDGSDTQWAAAAGDKVFLQSGEFTSTLKTSRDVSSHIHGPNGITYSLEASTESFIYCGVKPTSPDISHGKIVHQAGQFGTTIVGSYHFSTFGYFPKGIAWKSNSEYLWTGNGPPSTKKLFVQQGVTSTILTSLDVAAIESLPTGVNTTYHTVG